MSIHRDSRLVTSLLLGAVLFAMGCRNVCDEAIERLEACGDTSPSALNNCDERGECVAACVNDHRTTCNNLGTSDAQASWAYISCNNDCDQ